MKKGQDPRVEMYSAFTDPFHNGTVPWDSESRSVCTSNLAEQLKQKGITDVYIVGLAMDYCVQSTAIHAVQYGYRTWVVREGTRAVGGEEAAQQCTALMEEKGVRVVGLEGDEVGWVRNMKGGT